MYAVALAEGGGVLVGRHDAKYRGAEAEEESALQLRGAGVRVGVLAPAFGSLKLARLGRLSPPQLLLGARSIPLKHAHMHVRTDQHASHQLAHVSTRAHQSWARYFLKRRFRHTAAPPIPSSTRLTLPATPLSPPPLSPTLRPPPLPPFPLPSRKHSSFPPPLQALITFPPTPSSIRQPSWAARPSILPSPHNHTQFTGMSHLCQPVSMARDRNHVNSLVLYTRPRCIRYVVPVYAYPGTNVPGTQIPTGIIVLH